MCVSVCVYVCCVRSMYLEGLVAACWRVCFLCLCAVLVSPVVLVCGASGDVGDLGSS